MSNPYALAGDPFTTVEPGLTGKGAYIISAGPKGVAIYLSDRELDDLAAWIDGHLAAQRDDDLAATFDE